MRKQKHNASAERRRKKERKSTRSHTTRLAFRLSTPNNTHVNCSEKWPPDAAVVAATQESIHKNYDNRHTWVDQETRLACHSYDNESGHTSVDQQTLATTADS